MPTPQRTILHLDMDAFFASIEQLDNPALRGKPLLVGHDGPRGVVTTASYEARPFGCRSAMPMVTAKRLCPHAIVVPVRHARYRELSHQIFAILEKFSPLVEPVSIDEAYADLTGTEKLFGPPLHIATEIKSQVQSHTGLTASIGLAPNKFLAKLASDLQKPDGLVLITPNQIDTLLPPMPVTKLWGVGPAMAAKLKRLGINTIADLRNFPQDLLHQNIGDEAAHYLSLAHGIDHRPVSPDSETKSIGQEQTFETDLSNPSDIPPILTEQTATIARKLRSQHLAAKTLTLKIRFGNFQTLTRSKTLPTPTSSTLALDTLAQEIWQHWSRTNFQPIRLIGATASHLHPETEITDEPIQPTLFPDPDQQKKIEHHQKQKRLDTLTDTLNQKFGRNTLKRGT